MVLGANRNDVLKLVVAQGVKLTLIGVGIGIIFALGLSSFLSSTFYGVKPNDATMFILVSLVLTSAALIASYIPARAVTKVDPIMAMRYE